MHATRASPPPISGPANERRQAARASPTRATRPRSAGPRRGRRQALPHQPRRVADLRVRRGDARRGGLRPGRLDDPRELPAARPLFVLGGLVPETRRCEAERRLDRRADRRRHLPLQGHQEALRRHPESAARLRRDAVRAHRDHAREAPLDPARPQDPAHDRDHQRRGCSEGSPTTASASTRCRRA